MDVDKHEGDELRKWIKSNTNTQDLAEKIGTTPEAIYKQMKRQQVSSTFKLKLVQKGINVLPLDISPEEPIEALSDDSPAYGRKRKDSGTNNNLGIPVYEVSATASMVEYSGQQPEKPDFYVTLPGYEDCDFGMYVWNNSMYPTIRSGSMIMCKKMQNKNLIMYGEVYVLRTADYLMVKRLQKATDKKHLLCKSDNYEQNQEEFRRYEPFEVERDDILELYLVKGIIHKTQN